MKKLSLFLFILFTVIQLDAQQNVIYVKQGARGNGSSWQRAFGDLQKALLNAESGQEIWVAAGTYTPTQNNNRKDVFRIKNNIQLYGGFSGDESSRTQRDWVRNLTILSGEIGTADASDNSYTIVYTHNVNSNTIVDGFAISGAKSNGTTTLGDITRSGGAWYNDGSNGTSNPSIANCLFIDNYAREGAALYNNGKNGVCQPKIINCQFVTNITHLEGGAIYNDGRSGKANPTIQDCYFLDNTSNYGACIRNHADGGESIANVVGSIFEANISKVREIIYNGTSASDKCKAVLNDCHFFDNQVSMGSNNNNSSNYPRKKGYRQAGEIKYLRN